MADFSSFQKAITQGIPDILPPKRKRDPNVSHAPRRVIDHLLSHEDKVLAIKNALRYFPEEFHR